MIEGKDDPRSPERLMQRRTFTTDRDMTLDEFVDELGTHFPMSRREPMRVTISRGAFTSWYSPETDEEVADRLVRMAAHDERMAKWEQAKYEELKEKFGD